MYSKLLIRNGKEQTLTNPCKHNAEAFCTSDLPAADKPEKWLPIPDHPSYEASDLGHIRRIDGTPVRISYGGWKRSYQYVCMDGRPHALSRIILRTFRGEPPEGHECRHLNGVHDDNRLDNLKWGTHSENIKDQRRHGTWWRTGKQKLFPEDIATIHELRARGRTQQSIAERMGVSQVQISRILNGRTWNHDLGPADFAYSAAVQKDKKPRRTPRPEPEPEIPVGRPITEQDIPQVIQLASTGRTRFQIARHLDLCPVAITKVLLEHVAQ